MGQGGFAMTQPPGTETAALVAFSVVDGLLRRLVRQQTITPSEAADMIDGLIADLGNSTLHAAKGAVPVLTEMLQEYRKQAR